MASPQFLPALRFQALTRVYDPVVRVTTREAAFKARIVELAAVRAGERVLDLGCGTGTLALAIGRSQPGAAITGVDGDEAMLAQAQDKLDHAGVEVELRQAMAQALPFEDASFDVVVSSLFFHHLVREVKEQVAAEIVRVLRPGGRMVVADWSRPADLMMAVAALGIRLLDGAEPTRDNLAGRLPAILTGAGLAEVVERDAFRTAFGRMALLTARA